jgi:hypothetical protein
MVGYRTRSYPVPTPMTPPPSYRARRALPRSLGSWLRVRELVAIGAAAVVLSVTAGTVLTLPHETTAAEKKQAQAQLETFIEDNAQSLSVPETAPAAVVGREEFSATAGYASVAAGGTNHDWAKLVLMYAGLPTTESNVTVFTRWMRQENGTDSWWLRNNPLNNGWGSGGGGGLGSYANLDIAAQNAAEALHSVPGYSGIVAGFAASAPTGTIEAAIWASPWATSHYANGAHWSQAPVPVVKSPDGNW